MGKIGSNTKLIEEKKLMWDQASVMRQIGLLPSDVNRLPLNRSHPVQAKIVPAIMGHDQVGCWFHPTEERWTNTLLKEIGEDIVAPVKVVLSYCVKPGHFYFSSI
jgi:hypothetical protein